MPQFNYRGKDRAGQTRSGSVEASSYGEARKALQAQGISVSMLNEAAERPQRSLPVSSPVVEERSRPWGLLLGGLALLAALALGFWLWPRSAGDGERASLRPGEETRRVVMRGQVELLGIPTGARPDELLRDVRLTVIFPEVPTEITLYYPELKMISSGGFECPVYFLSSVEPTEANVSVRLSGFETFRATRLAVERKEDGLTLSVPRATMKARAGFVPRPGDDPGRDEDQGVED